VLSAPLLQKVKFWDVFLTTEEIYELLPLVRQRIILNNLLSMQWDNDFQDINFPWLAEEERFQLLLHTLRVVFPHLGTLKLSMSDE
jgi:hypothetical protein